MGLDKLHFYTKHQDPFQSKPVKVAACGQLIEIPSEKQLSKLSSNNMNKIRLSWKIFDFLDTYLMIIKMQ